MNKKGNITKYQVDQPHHEDAIHSRPNQVLNFKIMEKEKKTEEKLSNLLGVKRKY